MADPVAQTGQVLAGLLACGICGSDLDRELTPASGAWDLEPLNTGSVDVDGVPRAFDDLGRPDEHAKILVEPS